MSQHVTELCLLLVDDMYGELTSRVFAALMCHGRITIGAISHYTELSLRQVRYALAVLVQQNLALWYTVRNIVTHYEANCGSAYALVRSGKLIRRVEARFNRTASDLLTNLLLSGHARVADLEQAYCMALEGGISAHRIKPHPANGKLSNGISKRLTESYAPTTESFQAALSSLLTAGFLSTYHESQFRSETDNRGEAELIVGTYPDFKGELKGVKKLEYAAAVDRKLLDWRFGTTLVTIDVVSAKTIVNRAKGKKRKLETENCTAGGPEKKQRRANGSVSYQTAQVPDTGDDLASFCDDGTALRVNYDKLAVLARNEKLVEQVEQCLGTTASRVYAELLRRLEKDLICCNMNAGKTEESEECGAPEFGLQVSTLDVSTAMSKCEGLAGGIGYAAPSQIDIKMITHCKKKRRKPVNGNEAEVDSEASTIEEEDTSTEVHDDDAMDDGSDNYKSDSEFTSNLEREIEKDDDEASARPLISSHSDSESCLLLTRQNLLLLAEHPYEFATYIRRRHDTPESWTVNFRALSHRLRLVELESMIVSRYTDNGLRLVRILQEKGKLDEKAISSHALMNQKLMRRILTNMHEAGHLELQEIPRDTNRQASRTIFLWFFDPERCTQNVLGETYKTMARCLQRAKVERKAVQRIIDKAERTDVVGNEDQYLSADERATLAAWREKEEKLLGEVGRLDDLVAVLRDY